MNTGKEGRFGNVVEAGEREEEVVEAEERGEEEVEAGVSNFREGLIGLPCSPPCPAQVLAVTEPGIVLSLPLAGHVGSVAEAWALPCYSVPLFHVVSALFPSCSLDLTCMVGGHLRVLDSRCEDGDAAVDAVDGELDVGNIKKEVSLHLILIVCLEVLFRNPCSVNTVCRRRTIFLGDDDFVNLYIIFEGRLRNEALKWDQDKQRSASA